MQRFASTARPLLIQGLIFGAILAGAEIVVDFSSRLVTDTTILGTISLALNFIVGAIVGYRVAQRVGRLSSGLLAGLLTGLIGSLVYSLVNILLLLPNLDSITRAFQVYSDQNHLGQHYTSSVVLQIFLNEALYAALLAVILVVLGSLMGGAFGRRRFIPPSTPEEEQETAVEPPSAPVQ